VSEPIIRAEGLGKKYLIQHQRDRPRYRALRDVLAGGLKSVFGLFHGRAPNGRTSHEEFWALQDVSFEVQEGEVVGIIGRNGAGKSTLLKILSRITEPSAGRVTLNGRVASLLEVGTGFHPELTGRENIYLNGSILGMRRKEIDRKFDEIVAFSGVEKFLDTPVKRYSTGMYVRLAFAVAAHLEPDILVIDEVLAVGDADFQKKCLGKMKDVAKSGRTVLFVSHNMGAILNLCDTAVLLDRGQVIFSGCSQETIRVYLATTEQAGGRLNVGGRRFLPTGVEVLDAWLEKEGVPTGTLQFGDRAEVVLRLHVREQVHFGIELILRQEDGIPVAFGASGLAQDWELDLPPGEVRVRCQLPEARYASGHYSIDVATAVSGVTYLDYIECGLSFEIEGASIGERSWPFTQGRGQGFVLWDLHFSLS
jgi:lipopolysaccharide transport system ATP-binding protein